MSKKEEEQKINFIETLEKTKSNKFLLSEIRHLNEQIKIEKEKYAEKLYKKRELLGQTCETYSENRVSEYYILQSFYRDPQLKERYFSMDEIDELDRRDLVYIINIYNESYKKFEDINIQKIVVSDFFTMYVPFCDDVRNFFDKPLFGLSINQVKIITYAKMFKNIFERYSDMPDSVRNDPEKIMEYVNSKERSKEALSNVDKSGASTIVGAKSEDYKNLGIQTKNSKSLSDMLKQNGGKMNMEDLANLMS